MVTGYEQSEKKSSETDQQVYQRRSVYSGLQ